MPRVAKGRRPQREVCGDGMALFTAMSVHFMSHECSAKSEVSARDKIFRETAGAADPAAQGKDDQRDIGCKKYDQKIESVSAHHAAVRETREAGLIHRRRFPNRYSAGGAANCRLAVSANCLSLASLAGAIRA